MIRKTVLKRLLAAFVALMLFACCPAAGLGSSERANGAVGMNIADFHSVTFDGEPVDGGIFSRSALTVINIWQRWCGPCWAEMPYFLQLNQLYSATPEEDVQVWGALYYGDSPSTIPEAVEFVNENGYNWNHMLMCDEIAVAAVGGGDPASICVPQTLFVDRYGTVRAQVLRKLDSYEDLLALTEELLSTLNEEYAASAGDIDADGAVGANDALLALRYAMGLLELGTDQLLRGDVNGDGAVDPVDALLILRSAMGII